MWMAGGGIKGGQAIGATDEIGLRAVEDKVHIHDAHATILSLLGLDHRKLTYLFQGREQPGCGRLVHAKLTRHLRISRE